MMKRTNNYLASVAMTLLLVVLSSAGAWAQSEVVEVGKTTYGHGYLPSRPNEKTTWGVSVTMTSTFRTRLKRHSTMKVTGWLSQKAIGCSVVR